MKAIAQSDMYKLPASILYLEDLREIVDVLSAVSKEVRIVVPGYQLESPDELLQLANRLSTKTISEIKISAHQPHVTLDLMPYSARLYISDQSIELMGVLSKIQKIISKRKHPFWWALNPFFIPVLGPIAIYIGSRFSQWILGAIVLLTVALYWWSYYWSFKHFTVINLSSRNDRVSFWERNKDKIIISVFSVILGAIAKGLFDIFRTNN